MKEQFKRELTEGFSNLPPASGRYKTYHTSAQKDYTNPLESLKQTINSNRYFPLSVGIMGVVVYLYFLFSLFQ